MILVSIYIEKLPVTHLNFIVLYLPNTCKEMQKMWHSYNEKFSKAPRQSPVLIIINAVLLRDLLSLFRPRHCVHILAF